VAGSSPTAMEDGIDQQVTRDSDTASDGSRDAEAMEGEQDGGESENGVIVASAADLAAPGIRVQPPRRLSSEFVWGTVFGGRQIARPEQARRC
jgi:hypothetical protein